MTSAAATPAIINSEAPSSSIGFPAVAAAKPTVPFPAPAESLLEEWVTTHLASGHYRHRTLISLLNAANFVYNIFAPTSAPGGELRLDPARLLTRSPTRERNSANLRAFYKMSPPQLASVKAALDELVDSGKARWVRPDEYVFVHSLVYVPKPGDPNKMRIAINYIPLNDETIKEDTSGLRTVWDCIVRMVGGSLFCRMDASDWFFQYPLDPRDQYKTGVATPWGTLVFTVLGQGMTNSGTLAQEAMDRIVGPFLFTEPVDPSGTAYQDDAALAAISDDLSKLLEAHPQDAIAAPLKAAYAGMAAAFTVTPEPSSAESYTPVASFPPTTVGRSSDTSTAASSAPVRRLPRGALASPDANGRFPFVAPDVYTRDDFLPVTSDPPTYEVTHMPQGTALDKMFFALHLVLERAGLLRARINLFKSAFFMRFTELLGEHISEHGHRIPTERLQGLRDLALPTTKAECHSSVQLMSYFRKYVPNFSDIAAPLLDLLHADARFHWTDTHTIAYNRLKYALSRGITLAPIDPRYPLVLITDASKRGAGAILLTGPPSDLKPHFIGSTLWTPAQTKYAINDQEALAIRWAIGRLEPTGVFRGRKLIVRTDHANLTFYAGHVGGKTPTSMRIIRYFDYIIQDLRLDVDFVIEPGKDNIADALSRLGTTTCDTSAAIAEAYIRGQTPTSIELSRAGSKAVERITADATPTAPLESISHAPINAISVAAILPALPCCDSLNEFDPDCEVAAAYLGASERNPDATPLALRAYTDFCDDCDVLPPPPALPLVAAFQPLSVAAVADLPDSPLNPDEPIDPSLLPFEAVEGSLAAVNPVIPLGVDLCRVLSEAQELSGPPTGNGAQFVKCQRNGFQLWAVRDVIKRGVKNGVKYVRGDRVTRLYIPPDNEHFKLRSVFFHLAHTASLHAGIIHTWQHLRDCHVNYPGMLDDVEQRIKECLPCSRFETTQKARAGSLHPIVAMAPMQLVELDFIGPFQKTARGNKYIINAHDLFSKADHLYVCEAATAETTADCLMDLYRYFGLPHTIYHDGGSHFVNQAIEIVLQRLQIGNLTATPYHPSSVGGVESHIKRVNNALRKLVSLHPNTWDVHVPGVMRGLRADYNRMIGCSPDSVLMSFTPRQPSTITHSTTCDPKFLKGIPASAQALALAVLEGSSDRYLQVRERNDRAIAKEKAYFDSKRSQDVTFDVGQVVWRWMPAQANRDSKLTSHQGAAWRLYTIIAADPEQPDSYYTIRDVLTLVDTKAHIETLRACTAKLTADELILASRAPDTFVPMAILSHKGSPSDLNNLQFKVRWYDHDASYDSWELFYGLTADGKHKTRFGECDLAQRYCKALGWTVPAPSPRGLRPTGTSGTSSIVTGTTSTTSTPSDTGTATIAVRTQYGKPAPLTPNIVRAPLLGEPLILAPPAPPDVNPPSNDFEPLAAPAPQQAPVLVPPPSSASPAPTGSFSARRPVRGASVTWSPDVIEPQAPALPLLAPPSARAARELQRLGDFNGAGATERAATGRTRRAAAR